MNKLARFVSALGLLAMLAGGSAVLAADNQPASPPPPSAPAAPKLVNVNSATRPELEKLPGIGRVLAERIIAGRPYKAVDDLKNVEGLGPKTFEQIKPLVTVE